MLRRAIKQASTIRVGWPALGIMVAGWIFSYLEVQPGRLFHGLVEVEISFDAFWLVFVVLAMATWDLFVALDDEQDDPSLGFGPQRFPAWLRPWVVPMAFLAGIVLGHLFFE
jgi:hypothetical protein